MNNPMFAYHEAGHAVAAAALNVGFRYATMKPRYQGAAGSVQFVRGDRQGSLQMCVVLLSGAIAEAAYIFRDNGDVEPGEREAISEYVEEGASNDIAQAALHAAWLGHIWQRIVEIAKSTVVSNWPAIEEVAHRLICAGRIDACDVREIVTRHEKAM